MGIFKALFENKDKERAFLPISELHKAQEKLTSLGVEFLLPGLFNLHNTLYEADIINLLEGHVTQRGGTMVRSLSGCGSESNADTVRYVPRGRGRRIESGDKVVIAIASRKEPESSTYRAVQLREAKSRLNPDLIKFASGVRLFAHRLSLRFDADFPAILRLADLYRSKSPELQKITTVEEFADFVANALRAWHFEQYLGEYNYHDETLVGGDSISGKELAKHRAAINGLCVALECLQERTICSTYQDIARKVHAQMIEEAGNNVDGYWMNIHEVMGSENLRSFPFGYLCPGESLVPADGPILEGHRLYLHPFIRGVHYGFVVTVTADGWTLH